MTAITLNIGDVQSMIAVGGGTTRIARTKTDTTVFSLSGGPFILDASTAATALLLRWPVPVTPTRGSTSTTDIAEPPVQCMPTLEDLLAQLGDEGHEAFIEEQGEFDRDLERKYASGEIGALKYWRMKARLSQTDVAEAVSSTQPYVSLLEKGERQLTRRMAKRLSTVLRVSVSELLELES